MSCALFLPAIAFTVGVGDLSEEGLSRVSLTDDERCYVERVVEYQLRACETSDCERTTAAALLDVLNHRRRLRTVARTDVVFNLLRKPCEPIEKIREQRDCFARLSGLSFEDALREAGFRPAGVSFEGYMQLRTGLSETQVAFILGSYGEEVSYGSYGGQSTSVVQWVSGRRIIVATFTNGELTARAQSGL